MMTESDKKSCWVVTDGRRGMENQALGLAEAIGRQIPLSISIKRIKINAPFRLLPSFLWGNPFNGIGLAEDTSGEKTTFTSPFPDLWIACGRVTLPFSSALKKSGTSFVVQTQDPRTPTANFDVIVPPYHDNIDGNNISPMHGSPNRLTEEKLRAAARQLEGQLSNIPHPRIAVLIGGNSKAYKLSGESIRLISDQLQQLAQSGAGLMITTSRRTGAENTEYLQTALTGPNVFFSDGDSIGPITNPYFGMLGLADHILVTEESTNMITEAAFTGKPVHLLPLEGGHKKFERLHRALEKRQVTRTFELPLQEWAYEPLRETDRIALDVIKRWQPDA